jgi:hypothetical protein
MPALRLERLQLIDTQIAKLNNPTSGSRKPQKRVKTP